MSNGLSILFSDVKDFFSSENNRITTFFLFVVILQLLTIWLVIYVYLELSNGQYHFHMNTKNSLEKIHNVKIDKYDGDFSRELTTEEQLIRKNNRRFHLKYLFNSGN